MRRSSSHHFTRAHALQRLGTQRGIVLLEAMCALLIFAMGILGLVGLQVASIKQAAAAEYRATAVLQANDLISRMWVTDRSAANWSAQFSDAPTAGAGYTAWKAAWVKALPGASITGNEPTVTFVNKPSATGSLGSSEATIVISWRAPSDDKSHKYTVVAQLDQPQK